MNAIELGEARRKIIRDVLADHAITESEFFSKSRRNDLVEARKDAAKHLYALRLNSAHIGRIIKIDPKTVRHYLDGKYVKQLRHRARARHALPRIRFPDVLAQIAASRGISVIALAAQWLDERTEYETQARAA